MTNQGSSSKEVVLESATKKTGKQITQNILSPNARVTFSDDSEGQEVTIWVKRVWGASTDPQGHPIFPISMERYVIEVMYRSGFFCRELSDFCMDQYCKECGSEDEAGTGADLSAGERNQVNGKGRE